MRVSHREGWEGDEWNERGIERGMRGGWGGWKGDERRMGGMKGGWEVDDGGGRNESDDVLDKGSYL